MTEECFVLLSLFSLSHARLVCLPWQGFLFSQSAHYKLPFVIFSVSNSPLRLSSLAFPFVRGSSYVAIKVFDSFRDRSSFLWSLLGSEFRYRPPRGESMSPFRSLLFTYPTFFCLPCSPWRSWFGFPLARTSLFFISFRLKTRPRFPPFALAPLHFTPPHEPFTHSHNRVLLAVKLMPFGPRPPDKKLSSLL